MEVQGAEVGETEGAEEALSLQSWQGFNDGGQAVW
jgi:hypothetical protein